MRAALSQRDVVLPMQYDPKVQRKSVDDPSRHQRRSSIPFADRKPAVRFIRSIDQRKRSIAGPYDPKLQGQSNKPILKKSSHPILVDSTIPSSPSEGNVTNTNEDMEHCRYRVELMMDKLSRSERIGRGSLDVLTFPTTTRRVEAMSRYQGCLTVAVCTLELYTSSEEFLKKRKGKIKSPSMTDLITVEEQAKKMREEAIKLYHTAKLYYRYAKKRYNEWEDLVKKSTEFKIDQCKVKFPIYSNKKMPESVTLYEDALEDTADRTNIRASLEGYVRVCRSYPEGLISIHCDLLDPNEKAGDSVVFQDSSHDTQLDIIKFVVGHGTDLIFACNNFLLQGIEIIQDKEMDEGFCQIHSKINGIDYDEYFDPLCALDLKNALGELVARKAELLNTSEQLLVHCKWLLSFTRKFHTFAKRSISGQSFVKSLCCCDAGTSKRKLLQLLGIVSVEDLTVVMPLTLEIAQDLFHMKVGTEGEQGQGAAREQHGQVLKKTSATSEMSKT